MKNIFQTIKHNVTARQAAEYYGLAVHKNGMARCPFHQDKTPNMKLDERYYCFGCGATGDAVNLTQKLLELDAKAAALRLAMDFNIEVSERSKGKAVKKYRRSKQTNNAKQLIRSELWIDLAIHILFRYRDLLDAWQIVFAPQDPEEEWHPLFCESLLQKPKVEYLLDELLSCSKAEFEEMKLCCGKEVERIEKRLERLIGGNSGNDQGGKSFAGSDGEGLRPPDEAELYNSA